MAWYGGLPGVEERGAHVLGFPGDLGGLVHSVRKEAGGLRLTKPRPTEGVPPWLGANVGTPDGTAKASNKSRARDGG